MEINFTKLKGCFLMHSVIYSDNRGYFTELFRSSEFKNLTEQFFQPVQTNLSLSHLGAVRGIHFSAVQNGQKKLVSCVSGRINDYVVDLRLGSDTFGQWEKFELSPENAISIFIDSGIGHAFQALEDDTVVVYHVDSEYSKSNEKSISIHDEQINLVFDIPITHISDKDLRAPSLIEMQNNSYFPRI